MRLKKASTSGAEEIIKEFFNKSSAELSEVIPKWALGNHLDKLLDYQLHPNRGKYSIFFVEVKQLIQISNFGEVILDKLFTDAQLNDIRISRILSRWRDGLFIDPPTIYIDSSKKKLNFSDGRHRTKAAHFLGNKLIPIAIEKCEVNEIGLLISLNKSI